MKELYKLVMIERRSRMPYLPQLPKYFQKIDRQIRFDWYNKDNFFIFRKRMIESDHAFHKEQWHEVMYDYLTEYDDVENFKGYMDMIKAYKKAPHNYDVEKFAPHQIPTGVNSTFTIPLQTALFEYIIDRNSVKIFKYICRSYTTHFIPDIISDQALEDLCKHIKLTKLFFEKYDVDIMTTTRLFKTALFRKNIKIAKIMLMHINKKIETF